MKRKTPGERLAKLRRDAGLTQLQLADAIGWTQPGIAALESGARDVRTCQGKTLVALAAALKVQVGDLLKC